MDFEIRKDLTSSWFKTLQDSICHSISELEKNKIKFKSTTWKRDQNNDEGGGESVSYTHLTLPTRIFV